MARVLSTALWLVPSVSLRAANVTWLEPNESDAERLSGIRVGDGGRA